MMEHFFEPITGWFSFKNFYSDCVKKFPSGSRFVEVGCYEGRSFAYLMVEIINSGKNMDVTAIDSFTFTSETAGFEGQNILDVFIQNMKPVINKDDPFKVIKGDSSLSASNFEDESLDMVFLDADHRRENFEKDVRAWLPKVKKGGWLAGHDICKEHPDVELVVTEIFGDQWCKDYVEELVWLKIK